MLLYIFFSPWALIIVKHYQLIKKKKRKGNFPGGPVVENLHAKVGDKGSIPGLGRAHML